MAYSCLEFSIKLLLTMQTNDQSYPLQQTNFFPKSAFTGTLTLWLSDNSKRNREKQLCIHDFKLLRLPFLQINCSFQDRHTIHHITAYTPNFYPLQLLSTCLNENRMAMQQQKCKRLSSTNDLTVHTLTYFSITSLFFGLMCNPWYLSPQTDFDAPPPLPTILY